MNFIYASPISLQEAHMHLPKCYYTCILILNRTLDSAQHEHVEVNFMNCLKNGNVAN